MAESDVRLVWRPVSPGAARTDAPKDVSVGVAAAYNKDLWCSRMMKAEGHAGEAVNEEKHAAGPREAEISDTAAAAG